MDAVRADRVLSIDVGHDVQPLSGGDAPVGEGGHAQARLPHVRLAVERLVG